MDTDVIVTSISAIQSLTELQSYGLLLALGPIVEALDFTKLLRHSDQQLHEPYRCSTRSQDVILSQASWEKGRRRRGKPGCSMKKSLQHFSTRWRTSLLVMKALRRLSGLLCWCMTVRAQSCVSMMPENSFSPRKEDLWILYHLHRQRWYSTYEELYFKVVTFGDRLSYQQWHCRVQPSGAGRRQGKGLYHSSQLFLISLQHRIPLWNANARKDVKIAVPVANHR